MARFEKSRKIISSKEPREKTFEDSLKANGRKSRFNGKSRGKKGVSNMTKVVCSACNKECEVPFKPISTKPVYCDDCFSKKGKIGNEKFSKKNFNSDTIPNRDIDIINEKLNKIMKALKI